MTILRNVPLGFLLMLGVSLMTLSSASADNKKSASKAPKAHVYKKGKVSKAKTKKATAKATATKSRNMIFDGDTLDAERFSPGGFALTAAKRATYGSLIKLRSHFVSEILKSADDL